MLAISPASCHSTKSFILNCPLERTYYGTIDSISVLIPQDHAFSLPTPKLY